MKQPTTNKIVIHGVPEDKEEFFNKLGLRVVLNISKGRGMKKW